ncbi:Heme response regulator HssR [compost metagenome]
MAKILIVDDDPHIRELMRVCLSGEGLVVTEAVNGQDALEKVEHIQVDLVIIDIMMPYMDGWDLCRELRSRYDIPLLMVTALGESSQKVKGFQLGTDDYLVKPFDTMELIMRVKALLKRYRVASSQVVQVGELYIDRQTLEARTSDKKLMLPLKEFELLYKLGSYPGQIFTRTQLIEQIWGMDYEGDERTVDVHIKRLREKLEGITQQVGIATVRGLGYRLEMKL